MIWHRRASPTAIGKSCRIAPTSAATVGQTMGQTYYFETSTFNRIRDSDPEKLIPAIRAKIAASQSRIVFSAMVWEEFAHTGRPSQRRRLFSLARQVCDPVFLLHPEAIMRLDIGFVMRGVSGWSMDKAKAYEGDFDHWVSRGEEGSIIDRAPTEIFSAYKEHKREYVSSAKAIVSKALDRLHVGENANCTYGEFAVRYRRNQKVRDWLSETCIRLSSDEGSRAFEMMNLDFLPRSFEGYVDYLCAMLYGYAYRGMKVRRNDNIDLSHAAYFYHCDRLVTSDKGFSDIARLSPRLAPRTMTFDEFLTHH